MKGKILIWILLVTVIFVGVACTKPVEDTPSSLSGELQFRLNEDGESYSVWGIGFCTDLDVIIPATYNGLPVTTIADRAFYRCPLIKSVTIPEGVTSIGELAFYECSSLESVNISNTVNSIGKEAFKYCNNLKTVNLSNSLTVISDSMFMNCYSLRSLNMPEGLTTIGAKAFSMCGLLSIVIPESVTSIAEDALSGCPDMFEVCNKSSINIEYGYNVKQIITDESQTAIKVIDDYVFYDDGKEILLIEYVGNQSEITLPKYDGGKTYEIYRGAFYNNDTLTKVTIPDCVTKLGRSAFAACYSLRSVILPNTLKTIEGSVFDECKSLINITIPSSVTSIGEDVFHGCYPLVEICNKSDVEIDVKTSIIKDESQSAIKYIGDYVFYDNGGEVYLVGYQGNETEITLPTYEGGKEYGIYANAFSYNTKLTKVIIPDFVTSIGASAFEDCINLKSVELSKSIKKIEHATFYYCKSLESIVIPDGVEIIDWNAFFVCSSLVKITIPASLRYIHEKGAFTGCDSLVEIVNKSDLDIVPGKSTHGYVSYYAKCVTKDESQSAIKYVNDFVFFDDGVELSLVKYLGDERDIVLPEYQNGKEYTIDKRAFMNNDSLLRVIIPDTVTSINDCAFNSCISLREVIIPNSVKSIGDFAFEGCYTLMNISIPNSVTSIGNYSFNCCYNLSNLKISSSVESIGNGAFSQCDKLSCVVIPSSVTNMGEYVFTECPSLTIYCEAESKPSEWKWSWDYKHTNSSTKKHNVVWGYTDK